MTDFSELKGKTLTHVEGLVPGEDVVRFVCSDGTKYQLTHDQDCCESVSIESVVGDVQDLIGEPLLMAEEVTHKNENPEGVVVPECQESFTWTFYKLATRKGYVDIRWYGGSNGWYSESVDFEQIA